MIKIALITFAIFTSLATSCNKNNKVDNGEDPQGCLDKLKKEIQSQPPRIPAAQIWAYQYQGNSVYLLPAPCCDQFNPIYNLDCEILCHPDGGITGKGDGKCNDFHQTATGKRLVWTDERSAE